MPRLILHAGWHKTATTAIQAFAHRNRDALRRRGFWYPGLSAVEAGVERAHHSFAHALARAPSAFTPEGARAIAAEWVAAAGARGETVILSAEAICRHIDKSATGGWIGRRRAYLRRLAEVLSGFDVGAVLVLRRQDDFIRSLYQEHVMKATGLGALRFPEFRQKVRNSTRFLDNIALFEEAFPRVTVLVYEDLPRNEALCEAFFGAIGVDASGLRPVGVVRRSPTAAETLVKRIVNPHIAGRERNSAVLEWLAGEEVQALVRAHCDGAEFGIWESPEARAGFLSSFDAENRALLARYFPGRERLFPPLQPDREPQRVELPSALEADLLRLLKRQGEAGPGSPFRA